MTSDLRHFFHQVKRPSLLTSLFLITITSSLLAESIVTPSNAAETDKLHTHTEASLTASITLFQAKKFPEATVAFTNIVAAEPKNAEALFYLGRLALQNNELTEAVKRLEQATSLNGTQSRYFQFLGDAYGLNAQRASVFGKMGWAKKCLTAYDKAVALDPDNLDARNARMEFYRHAPGFVGGGMDKAYAEAEEIQKRNSIRGLLLLCDLYIQDKKTAEAFSRIEKLILEQPETKGYLYVLGTLAAVSGQRIDRGTAALTSYLEHEPKGKDPTHAWTHLRLGHLYEKKGDKAAARAEYEASLQIKPDFIFAQQSLKNLK